MLAGEKCSKLACESDYRGLWVYRYYLKVEG